MHTRKLILSTMIWLVLVTFIQLVYAAPPRGDSVAAERLDSAREAYGDQDWDAAADAYKALAEENPYNGRFWYRLAASNYALKRYAESATAYQQAVDLGHQLGTSYYNMACDYALLGEHDKAIDAIEMAIQSGLQNREELIRDDTDLAVLRDTRAFRERILPHVDENTSRTDGWRTDLDYLTRRMEQTHFDVYRNISADEWRREISKLNRSIPNLKDHEIHVRLMQLVARIGDGHSSVWTPQDGDKRFHFAPVRFYAYKDGLFVKAAAPAYRAAVGGRVLRIGKTDAGEAMARVSTVTQRDNDQQILWIAPRFMSLVEILDGLDIVEGLESIDLTVEIDGAEKTFKIMSQLYTREIMRGGIANAVSMNSGADNPVPMYLKDSHNNYWFEYLPDEKLVYFQFNGVRNKEDESIADFSDRLFDFVAANDVDALVIDVRLNHGGNNYLVEPIIRNVIRSDKINERGKLFMIIGRETFSACQNFTNRMQVRTNATFVGEPTGSRPNFVGEGNPIHLPYSGLTVNGSSRYWQDTRSDDLRVWVAPDLAAELTSDDFRSNRDPAMDVIRAYLKHRKNTSS